MSGPVAAEPPTPTRALSLRLDSRELFERLAHRADLQVPGCPVDDWMTEDYGLDIAEQFNLGFAVSAITHAWDDDPRSNLYVSPENFDDLLLKLGLLDRRHQALELISATREQFQAEFAAAGTSAEHLAWETRPFMRHPCLRTNDDGLVLISAKAMQSWLTDGFYCRLLTSAQRRSVNDGGRTSNLFTSFAGSLLETYELEVMRSVLPGERPPGAGRVHGEQPYGRGGGKRTSDVAVDLGQDLVLFEVSNSRLRADTLILGDNERVKADLDRMIIRKIKQLDGCIEALFASEATIPGVDISHVMRIWPVIVTAGEITQTSELWMFIDRESAGRLTQPKVQPPDAPRHRGLRPALRPGRRRTQPPRPARSQDPASVPAPRTGGLARSRPRGARPGAAPEYGQGDVRSHHGSTSRHCGLHARHPGHGGRYRVGRIRRRLVCVRARSCGSCGPRS
jgi:hypothetical protein